MSLQVEMLEKGMAKLTIEVSADEFEKAVEKVYLKNKGRMNIQGFRKGKAPRHIIEKMYGSEVFFEDAANMIIPEAYEKEAMECDVDIVSQPKIDVEQIEKGKPFIFTATVAVKPEVTLGDYKGIKVDKVEVAVSEEDVDKEIDMVREQNARTLDITDRAAENNDIVTIDFEGFMDGEAFEGGKGTDYPLTLGSHSFIDTFEEQIVGKNIGDEFDVNVTFPEDYQAKELAGKPALFKVALKAIKAKELPELDDDFASDVSEFETVAEYKDDIRATLLKKKEDEAKSAKEDQVIAAIVENATMEIPEAMIDTQVRQMADDFARRIQAQGLSLEQYFQFTGMDASKFMETLKPQALKKINSRLVLEAVVNAENIEVAEDEVEAELTKLAEAYKMEIDKVKELMGNREIEAIKMDLAVQKAVDFVTDAAVEA
ncbi:MAG: trigger factor [Lachnospiraceae bacterium]|nr:trigger factor [Lachnospiraceae bacterium]